MDDGLGWDPLAAGDVAFINGTSVKTSFHSLSPYFTRQVLCVSLADVTVRQLVLAPAHNSAEHDIKMDFVRFQQGC